MRDRSGHVADIAAAIVLLCVAGTGWVLVRSIPSQPVAAGLGPAFFPILVLTLITLLAAGLLLRAWFGVLRAPAGKPGPSRIWRASLTAAALAGYVAAIHYAGLLPATAVFLLVTFRWLDVRPGTGAIATLCVCLALYLLFGMLFRIRLF